MLNSQIQAATSADLDAVAALAHAHFVADYGEPLITRADIARTWDDQDLAQSTRLLRDAAGTLIGYLLAAPRAASIPLKFDLRIYLHPHHRTARTASLLVGEVTDLAHKQAAGRACELQSVSTNAVLNQAFEQADYAPLITFQTMAVDLPATLDMAPLTDLTLRPFRVGIDEQAAYQADEEASRDKGYADPLSFEDWAAYLLPEPELCWLAWDGAVVAGGVFCARQDGTGIINHLGVRQPWRRRGLGQALMQTAFDGLAAQGLRQALLHVDAASRTGAHLLYSRCGMHITGKRTIYTRALAEQA